MRTRLLGPAVVVVALGCGLSPPGREALAAALSALLGAEREPNNTLLTATPVGPDSVTRASLAPNADTDFYAFDAGAGDRVYATLVTTFTASGAPDGVLEVVGPDGGVLELDNDDGSQGDLALSLAGVVIPGSGTWFLRVTRGSAFAQLRPYDLHFRLQGGAPVPEQEPNGVGSPQPLAAPGWVAGALASSTDVDRYAITVAAGETIFASLDLDPERDATETDAQLALSPSGRMC